MFKCFFLCRRNTKKTDLELKCSVLLQGDYTLSGKLLILPIEGNGKYRIKIRKYTCSTIPIESFGVQVSLTYMMMLIPRQNTRL